MCLFTFIQTDEINVFMTLLKCYILNYITIKTISGSTHSKSTSGHGPAAKGDTTGEISSMTSGSFDRYRYIIII